MPLPKIEWQIEDRRMKSCPQSGQGRNTKKHPPRWDGKTQTEHRERTDKQTSNPFPNGQVKLGEQFNTDWRLLWLSWKRTRIRNPIKSFMWKLTNRVLPTLPGSCTTCFSPWTQDHVFWECPHTIGPTLQTSYSFWFSTSNTHSQQRTEIILNLWAI